MVVVVGKSSPPLIFTPWSGKSWLPTWPSLALLLGDGGAFLQPGHGGGMGSRLPSQDLMGWGLAGIEQLVPKSRLPFPGALARASRHFFFLKGLFFAPP